MPCGVTGIFPSLLKPGKSLRIQLQEKSPTFDKLGGLHGSERHDNRLQNIDSVFCVFKKARTVKLKVWRFLRYYNATRNSILRKKHWRGRNRANPIHTKCKKMDFSQRANSKPIEKAWLIEQKPPQCALTFQRKIVTLWNRALRLIYAKVGARANFSTGQPLLPWLLCSQPYHSGFTEIIICMTLIHVIGLRIFYQVVLVCCHLKRRMTTIILSCVV